MAVVWNRTKFTRCKLSGAAVSTLWFRVGCPIKRQLSETPSIQWEVVNDTDGSSALIIAECGCDECHSIWSLLRECNSIGPWDDSIPRVAKHFFFQLLNLALWKPNHCFWLFGFWFKNNFFLMNWLRGQIKNQQTLIVMLLMTRVPHASLMTFVCARVFLCVNLFLWRR